MASFSWNNMDWNISGEVTMKIVDSEDVCKRLVNLMLIYYNLILENNDFRSNNARVLLNTVFTNAFNCFDTCKKYNRAQSPMFSDENGMKRLFGFLTNTTTDPVTKLFYKDSITSTVWLPIR